MTEKFPAIVDRFVRSGEVKIEYRSLETDTLKTKNFSRQEIAALAVGRQDGMWNFIETFVREQGQEYSGYATGQFVTGIALQVPGLDRARWLRDREDVQLFDQVALSDHHARMLGMHGTPMFLIGRSSGGGFRRIGSRTEPGPLLDVATLRKGIDSVFGGSAGVAPG
jgi:hypothetical protein